MKGSSRGREESSPTENLHVGLGYGSRYTDNSSVVSLSIWIDPQLLFSFRGQAECDELAQRAEVLKEENASLRTELSRLRSEHDQLAAQNASLKVFCHFLSLLLSN